MPVQQQMASFAGRLGSRLAGAHAEHAGKPPELGPKRLPAGLRGAVARLSTMYTKEQTEDSGVCPKGEVFFRASAVVTTPVEYAGSITSVVIPLCEIPEKVGDGYTKKGVSFSDNWNKFRSLLEVLGVSPFPEPPLPNTASEAERVSQGARIETYFFGAMLALTSVERMKTNPIYIEFSTRGFTPKPTAMNPKPQELVFEDWHGLATAASRPVPGSGVVDALPPTQPPRNTTPPSPNGVAPPTAPAPAQSDPADAVAALVEVAMNDPEGATEEGGDASAQLERMAWANGWTKEQTASAADWSAVGDMALNKPTDAPVQPPPGPAPTTGVVVGSQWMFAKRTKDGARLKNAKGEEFPPTEVEVVTVDTVVATCTVKTTRDNKPVVDIRSKEPVAVKFEWLEKLPF